MKTKLELYLELQKELLICRLLNGGVGTEKEQPIIDNMEQVWFTLSPEEEGILDKTCPSTFPSHSCIKFVLLKRELLRLKSEKSTNHWLMDQLRMIIKEEIEGMTDDERRLKDKLIK